jgi:single-strand DNA-binding protein
MIQATVTGNIGRKPEAKETRSGKQMTAFSVASSQKRDGQEAETTWIDCVCFDELASGVLAQADKGMRVVVTGTISMETYRKKDGGEGSSLRMLCNEVALTLRSKREDDGERRAPARSADRGSDRGREPW